MFVEDCPTEGAVFGNGASAKTALVSGDNNASLRSAFVRLVMTANAKEPFGERDFSRIAGLDCTSLA